MITIPRILRAVNSNAQGLLALASTKETPLPFVPNGNVLNPASVAARTPVGLPAVMLQPMIAASNDSVVRYRMPPSSVHYLAHNFTPTGNLRRPLLTVHNAWDPAVPLMHEVELTRIVQAAGTSSMLLQRQVPLYGHCVVPAPVVAGAFTDLVGWVNSGVKRAVTAAVCRPTAVVSGGG